MPVTDQEIAFPPEFTPSLRDRLLVAIRLAYGASRAHHDPSVGHDSQTFGTLVYKSAWHFLRLVLIEEPGVETVFMDGALQVRLGPYVIQCYKLGHTARENVWRSFPGNEDAAGILSEANARQLALPTTPPIYPSNYVLGHFGNPVDGMAKAYLCVPFRASSGQITQWIACDRLDATTDEQVVEDSSPQAVPLARPVVTLRPGVRGPGRGDQSHESPPGASG